MKTVKMENGQHYTIFRHITVFPSKGTEQAVTFIVRFKFARLSHNANRIASIIPMLLITGFPGFQTKIHISPQIHTVHYNSASIPSKGWHPAT